MIAYILCAMGGSAFTLAVIGLALRLNKGGRDSDPFG